MKYRKKRGTLGAKIRRCTYCKRKLGRRYHKVLGAARCYQCHKRLT